MMSPSTRAKANALSFVLNTIAVPTGLSLIALGYLAVQYFKPEPTQLPLPRIVHSYWLESSVIKFGEPLKVWSDVTVNEVCPAIIERFVLDARLKGNVWSTIGAPQVAKVSVHNRVLNIQRLPDYIGPGDYIYRTVVFDTCRNQTFVVTSPEIEFTILPRE